MNANLPPLKIKEWLAQATKTLSAAGIPSARLDALLFLSDTLRQSKSWLLAHDDEPLHPAQLAALQSALEARRDRQPVAYIRGHQEFYGREFRVTPTTLIPRPESEEGIELLKSLQPLAGQTIIDVGTGTGCLAITAALELPSVRVIACDISPEALKVAAHNAQALKASVTFFKSDLLAAISQPVEVIIANLPYVDPSWERSAETEFEPSLALFAEHEGLALIYKLITQTTTKLKDSGALLLEADPQQHAAIAQAAVHAGFTVHAGRFWLECRR